MFLKSDLLAIIEVLFTALALPNQQCQSSDIYVT